MIKKLVKYVYQSKLIRVIDGDTMKFSISLGFNINLDITGRVLDLNTPETRGPEKVLGKIYKQAAINILETEKEIIINTSKKGKYGRWLVDIYIDGKDYKKLLEKEVRAILKNNKKGE